MELYTVEELELLGFQFCHVPRITQADERRGNNEEVWIVI